MTDAKLKSLVERINRLIDERDGVSADIRDIYSEAKSNGLCKSSFVSSATVPPFGTN